MVNPVQGHGESIYFFLNSIKITDFPSKNTKTYSICQFCLATIEFVCVCITVC